jgi:hypothetical protein
MELGANFETIEKIYYVGGDRWWVWLIKVVILAAVLGFLLFKSIERVPAGHVAIKLRFGDVKRYKYGERKGKAVVKHAGLHWVMPTWHGWLKVSIMERTIQVLPQTRKVAIGNNDVEGSFTFQSRYDPNDPKREPEDVVRLALKHGEIDERVLGLAQAQHRKLIAAKFGNETVEEMMVANMKALLKVYGLRPVDYNVTRDRPTEATQLAQAFKDTGFQVNLPPDFLHTGNGHQPAVTADSS